MRAGVRFEVVVLGDGPERDALERRARGLALGPRVRFAGAVPNDRVWDVVGRAHGLVQPSVRCGDGDVDGIPNVILEAMASRRPVVGTRLSGIPEVVVDGRTGRLVEPGDPDALAHAMREVGDGRDAARAMGERGRALVEEMFDLDRNLEAQLAILAGAVG